MFGGWERSEEKNDMETVWWALKWLVPGPQAAQSHQHLLNFECCRLSRIHVINIIQIQISIVYSGPSVFFQNDRISLVRSSTFPFYFTIFFHFSAVVSSPHSLSSSRYLNFLFGRHFSLSLYTACVRSTATWWRWKNDNVLRSGCYGCCCCCLATESNFFFYGSPHTFTCHWLPLLVRLCHGRAIAIKLCA